MSYEGYEQHICKNGHYYECDAYYFVGDEYCKCGAPSAWSNSVDQTNGQPQGKISLYALHAHFLLTDEVVETCNLGHQHTTSEAVFRIPTREETDPLRQYYDED